MAQNQLQFQETSLRHRAARFAVHGLQTRLCSSNVECAISAIMRTALTLGPDARGLVLR